MIGTDRNTKIWDRIRRLDWSLLVVVGLIAVLGLINMRSASMNSEASFHISHTVWLVAGFGVAIFVAFLSTRFFIRWAYGLYGVSIALLAAVALFGTEINASQRWLDLGLFMVQPSELLKLTVILVTARFFQDRNKEGGYAFRELWMPGLLVGIGVLFVVGQPDLGTALVILATFGTLVVFEGVRWQSLALLAWATITALILIVQVVIPMGYHDAVLHEYQQDRIASFLNLDDDARGKSWQIRQSMIAVGSGQVWGKGEMEGTQVQKGFVPEHENDFIAANWAEERGFVGMVVLLGLYVALIGCALRISRRARHRFGAVVAVGVAALFFWHILVNLGMVTGVLPVVGLTLPLMSYGGSSLLVMLAGVGLLLNISMNRRPYGH